MRRPGRLTRQRRDGQHGRRRGGVGGWQRGRHAVRRTRRGRLRLCPRHSIGGDDAHGSAPVLRSHRADEPQGWFGVWAVHHLGRGCVCGSREWGWVRGVFGLQAQRRRVARGAGAAAHQREAREFRAQASRRTQETRRGAVLPVTGQSTTSNTP